VCSGIYNPFIGFERLKYAEALDRNKAKRSVIKIPRGKGAQR